VSVMKHTHTSELSLIDGKVEPSLCLTKHYAIKSVENECKYPRFLDLGISWR
jgi:hypothetical protein